MRLLPFAARRSITGVSLPTATPAVEAGVHPGDVVQEEDEDVRLLSEALLQCGELGPRLAVLFRVRDDRVHVVGRLHVRRRGEPIGMVKTFAVVSPVADPRAFCAAARAGTASRRGRKSTPEWRPDPAPRLTARLEGPSRREGCIEVPASVPDLDRARPHAPAWFTHRGRPISLASGHCGCRTGGGPFQGGGALMAAGPARAEYRERRADRRSERPTPRDPCIDAGASPGGRAR